MLGVCSELPASGDRVWLGSLGSQSGLRFATTYPGGPADFAMTLTVPPSSRRHRAWTPGRRISVWSGGTRVWYGFLEEPSVSDYGVIGLSGVGIASAAARFGAVAPGPSSDYNGLFVDAQVDAAISRGWAVKRVDNTPGLFGAMWGGTVKDSLDKAAELTGQYWVIVPDTGELHWELAPVQPSFVLWATGQAGGRTLNDTVNALYPYFADSAAGGAKKIGSAITSATAITAHGRLEGLLDLTNIGQISAAQAATAATEAFNRQGSRARWSGSFLAAKPALCNIGGAPANPAWVRAGRRLRVWLANIDQGGETSPGPVEFVIGQAEYDDDTETVSVTPLESARSDLFGLLERAGRLPKGNPV